MGMASEVSVPATSVAEGSEDRGLDELRAAIKASGGATKLAKAIGVQPDLPARWLELYDHAPAEFCGAIEKATGVRCDALRPDLQWLRDGAGEVLGYVTALPGVGDALLRQATAQKTNGIATDEVTLSRAIARAMADGVMLQLSETAKAELRATYRLDDPSVVITQAMLKDLALDADEMATDRLYHYGYGIMYGLSDDTCDRLREKYDFFEARTYKKGEFAAFVEEVRVQRGIDCAKPLPDDIPWIDDLLTWYTPFEGDSFSTAWLERKRQAADNLSECLLDGLVALSDYQWMALANGNSGAEVNKNSQVNAAYFSRTIGELLKRVTDLRSQFDFGITQNCAADAKAVRS